MNAVYLTIGALFGFGLWLVLAAMLLNDRSFVGRKTLRRIERWQQKKYELWDAPLVKAVVKGFSRLVFLDEAAKESLKKQLSRAGLNIEPQQYAARKYLIFSLGVFAGAVCAGMKFWFGIVVTALLVLYGVLAQKDKLASRIKKRDEAISMEMPRFVRTICRSLRSSRDIYAALESYRKVAGPVLGSELDILIAEMRAGSVPRALGQFQRRIGSDSAFRLCSTLQDIDRGIDQTATLEYLSDDMARQAKLNIQKTLATRPASMRRTYLPAVGVCVVMIIYVLIVFVEHQLITLT